MLTIWDIRRKVMEIGKPRIRPVAAGVWLCEVECKRRGVQRFSYGATPEESWHMWCFENRGLAPPSLLRRGLIGSFGEKKACACS